MSAACLDIRSLSAVLPNGQRVLRSVSLSVQPGEVRALVGESGAGKTMIGKAVLGVLPALQKPTVATLSDDAWVAVNTIIEESAAWEIIPRLKAANAEGIVEYPLNKVVM